MEIVIGGEKIGRVQNTKYLGLILDEKLRWHHHLEYIKSKIIPMVGALYRCRKYLNTTTLTQIYNAFFLSHFRYLIPIWGTCGTTLFQEAQRLQNKVIKVLFNLDYKTPTTEVYQQTKIAKLSVILKIEQSKFIYKMINKQHKSNVETIFVNQIHNYKTRNQHKIHIPSARTNIGLHNPIHQSMNVFNQLPQELKILGSFKRFKREIQHHNFVN